MATIIAQELKKWRDTLNIDELDPYDITVANIILQNFEELIDAGGTAGGKRIKKFAELVSAKKRKMRFIVAGYFYRWKDDSEQDKAYSILGCEFI